MITPDLWEEMGVDPTDCPVCGRDVCDHASHVGTSTQKTADEKRPNGKQLLIAYSLAHLLRHSFPARRSLLIRGNAPVIREGHIGCIVAMRGVGKTWFSQTLALIAASGGQALGFHAPEPFRTLYVDGEMVREDIQSRFALLRDVLNVPPSVALTIVAADWQERFLPRLDTEIGQMALEPFVDAADFIILDNRSCLFDPEGEKDPTAWQAAQNYLLSLRRRGKTVLFDHHANRQGGARGHSKSEDILDVIIKLSRPDGYAADQGARFLVEFDKVRGAHGVGVAPFVAHLTPRGWLADSPTETSTVEKLVEYLRRANRAGERPKSANAAISGAHVNRNAGLEAWADLLERGIVQAHPEGGFYAV